jgi:hypothetical protein
MGAVIGFMTNKLKLKLSCDLPSVGQSVLVSGSHLQLMTRCFSVLTIAGFLMCGVLSDERIGLYLLVQLLLVLVRAVTFRFKSRRTRDHILLSHLESPNLEARSPFISPGTGWPSYTPRHWVPFSSSLTARRAAVEVFQPSFTRVNGE